jgi:hypothetical protein
MAELKAYRYTVEWKYKGEGNKTEHVGVCPTCLELVEPEWQGRKDTPFVDYYEHQHKLVFLVLLSNNNRRHWAYEGDDSRLWQALKSAGRLWESGVDIDAVKAHIRKMLEEFAHKRNNSGVP